MFLQQCGFGARGAGHLLKVPHIGGDESAASRGSHRFPLPGIRPANVPPLQINQRASRGPHPQEPGGCRRLFCRENPLWTCSLSDHFLPADGPESLHTKSAYDDIHALLRCSRRIRDAAAHSASREWKAGSSSPQRT